jgi:hypothetical protein
MNTIDIANIPVIQKSPVTGLGAQELLVQAGFSNPITIPNGLLIAVLGKYTQGTSVVLAGSAITLHDFTIGLGDPLLINLWGGQNGQVTSKDVETVNSAAGSPMPVGTWDVLVIIFDIDRPPAVSDNEYSFADHIIGYRAGVIAVNALIIN